MSQFGNNIKKIRSVRGLTQQQLAEKLDITRGSVSSYEEGRAEPKIETILKTADFFAIPVEQLLTQKLTVNQLIGFKHPEKPSTLAKNANNISNTLPDFQLHHPSFIVIDTTKVVFESNRFSVGNIVFAKPIAQPRKGIYAVLVSGTWWLDEMALLSPTTFTIAGQEFTLEQCEKIAQIIGVYSPIQLHNGIVTRLEKLETSFLERSSL